MLFCYFPQKSHRHPALKEKRLAGEACTVYGAFGDT